MQQHMYTVKVKHKHTKRNFDATNIKFLFLHFSGRCHKPACLNTLQSNSKETAKNTFHFLPRSTIWNRGMRTRIFWYLCLHHCIHIHIVHITA